MEKIFRLFDLVDPIIFRTNTDFRGFEIGQTKDYVKDMPILIQNES